MKALIIDDSRAIRRMIGNIVRDLGFEAVEAGNGREGLERAAEGAAPDLVLVDWNMPEMNGLEFVTWFRQRPEFTRVPVMMVTTETEAGHVVQALDAGADEYLMKPFTREALVAKLAMLGVGGPGGGDVDPRSGAPAP